MHEVASRAVRRLDVVEWVGLGAAAVVAVAGGGLVALLLAGPLGIPARTLWVLASVLLLALPGGVALAGARRAEGRVRSQEDTNRG